MSMNALYLPRTRRLPIPTGEPEAMHLCRVCDLGDFCRAEDCRKQVRDLDVHVEHTGSYAPGTHLFRDGDPITSLIIIRTGTVKLFTHDAAGNDHVTGFAMPGDVIGLDAIHSGRYRGNARALDDVSLCQLSIPAVLRVAGAVPRLQRSFIDLLSRHIEQQGPALGRYDIDRRFAAFLLHLSRHAERRGLSPTRLTLGMTRVDIANYLRLTAETVSRLISRFQQRRLIEVDKRNVRLLALDSLREIAVGAGAAEASA